MIKFSANKLLLFVVVQFFTPNAFSQQLSNNGVFYNEGGWTLGASVGTLWFERLNFDITGNINVGNDVMGDPVKVLTATGYSDLTQTIPVPSATLVGEYRPANEGLSLGIEGSYFQQDHEGSVELCFLAGTTEDGDVFQCSEEDMFFDGKSRSIILLTGGNYFFGNRTLITPYLTADVGIGATLVQLNNATNNDEIFVEGWGYHSVIQAGAGFDIDLGPATLGGTYNYIMVNEYNVHQNEQMQIQGTSGNITNVDLSNRFTFRELGGHRGELKISIKPGTLRGAR